ncbi:membrane protein insertase YidC [Massilibacteroides sp.]|uniref:membrane protein insertase YidC n=1 Tax=Massilibacteroides sp. TaxID=2034766 RepID=UPI002617435A|nr:membrane protein insertase YidC [Massilibacteroides sp.]MDD4514132.1 membrane protein insertase YidC [Massilibacteroides sp.]
MDKNTITGFVLIGILLFAFTWFNQPSPEQIEAQQRYNDSIAKIELQKQLEEQKKSTTSSLPLEDTSLPDSAKAALLEQSFGVFSKAMSGTNETITLENELLEVKFNTKGGNLAYARLKEYDTYDSLPLVLFDETQTSLNIALITAANKVVNTSDLHFKPIKGSDPHSLTMRLEAGEGSYLDFIYTLPANEYRMGFSVESKGLNGVLSPSTNALEMSWQQSARQLEKGRKYEDRYTALYYKYMDDKVKNLSETGSDNEKIPEQIKWIAYKNKFFSTVLISSDGFESVVLDSRAVEDPGVLMKFASSMSVPFDLQGNTATSLQYYIGPNKYGLLHSYDKGLSSDERLNLERLVPLGASVFRYVNKYFIIPIFDFLGQHLSSYGLIIFLLTLIVKIVLLPLTYKSYMSSAKMRVLRPQVEELNAKYPGQENAMERQKATMELYSRAGASPMSGCVPMLLQMPILIALFMFFPSAIELRHESFLWASDLSTYDAIVSWDAQIPIISTYFGNHISLFCLLMVIVNLVYTKFNMEMSNTGQQQMPGMKAMMYMMPLMLLVFFNQYASGLNYYYFISTLMTVGQTLLFRYTINEEKLLAKLEENKKKPMKKSGFMKRLEDAQKMQEEQLRKQKEQRKRK